MNNNFYILKVRKRGILSFMWKQVCKGTYQECHTASYEYVQNGYDISIEATKH